MGNGQPIEIQYYRDPNSRQPFTEWFESIRDKNTQQRIDKRLARLEDGNFGDCQSVGGGVFNCISTLEQDIASILVKLKIHSSFCFVVEIRNRNKRILKSQKPIGGNIRRHINERNGNWHVYRIRRLANDQETAIDFLELTLEAYLADGDLPFFLKELQVFMASQGGVVELSKRTNIKTEIFLEILSGENAPQLDILRTILNALERLLSIESMADTNANLEIAD